MPVLNVEKRQLITAQKAREDYVIEIRMPRDRGNSVQATPASRQSWF